MRSTLYLVVVCVQIEALSGVERSYSSIARRDLIGVSDFVKMLEERESKDLVERTLDNSPGQGLGKYAISTIFESVGTVRGRFFVVKLDCIDYFQDQPSMYAIWTNIFEDDSLANRLATGRDTFTTLTDALSAFERLVDKYHLQLQRKK